MTDYRNRLALALEAGEKAGLSPAVMFPAALRGLFRLGLPVRPLHYMSTLGLLVWLAVGLGAPLSFLYWLGLGYMEDGGRAPRYFVAIVNNGGWSLLALLIGGLALLTALTIRAQALFNGLPRWRDL